MRVAYFFDVDDTTIDSRHRVQPPDKADWAAYFKAAIDDTAMPWTKEYFKNGAFKYGEHHMLTGRLERDRHETRRVLHREGIARENTPLTMRQDRKLHGRTFKCLELVRFATEHPDTILIHFDNCVETVACINSIRSERIKAFEFSYDSDPKVIDAICAFAEQVARDLTALPSADAPFFTDLSKERYVDSEVASTEPGIATVPDDFYERALGRTRRTDQAAHVVELTFVAKKDS